MPRVRLAFQPPRRFNGPMKRPTTRTAVLAGATGLVGGFLLRELLGDPSYSKITILVRPPLSLRHPKLRQLKLDFDRLEGLTRSLQARDWYCALGTTIRRAGSPEGFRKVDYGYITAFGRAASRTPGTSLYLVSSQGASNRSPFFYLRVKGETEEALKKLPLRALHLFRPSLLLGPREVIRRGEAFAGFLFGILGPFLVGPLRRFRPVAAEAVAQSMVGAARQDLPGIHLRESETLLPSSPERISRG